MPVHFHRRRRVWPRVVLAIIIFLMIPTLILAGIITFQKIRPTLTAFKAPALTVNDYKESAFRVVIAADGTARLRKSVSWQDKNAGKIELLIDVPSEFENNPKEKRPVLFLVSGLRKGQRNIESFPGLGNNVLIGFEYPMPNKIKFENAFGLEETPRFYSEIMQTPGQIAAALQWITEQSWAEQERITVVAASLGSFITPAALHLWNSLEEAQRHQKNYALVIGYGGADLSLLFSSIFAREGLGGVVGDVAAYSAAGLLDPLEPAYHLPHMQAQKTLILSGKTDGVIPEQSVILLEKLAAQPKDIRRLKGGHVGDEENANRIATQAMFEWLAQEALINPVPETVNGFYEQKASQ